MASWPENVFCWIKGQIYLCIIKLNTCARLYQVTVLSVMSLALWRRRKKCSLFCTYINTSLWLKCNSHFIKQLSERRIQLCSSLFTRKTLIYNTSFSLMCPLVTRFWSPSYSPPCNTHKSFCWSFLAMNSEEFWQWNITICFIELLDFDHLPKFQI